MNEQVLLDLYTKFEHLKNCNKKADKIECLKEYQHDTLFTFVLEFLLNTHKKTGISDSKLKKEFSDEKIQLSDKSLEDILSYLVKNNSGKDENIIEVQCFIYTVKNFTLKKFVRELVTKKYKCGVTAKFVGEILPDLIKIEHQVMLANKFKGELKEKAYVSLKLDGIRCTALITEDDIKFLSRQGKEIKGLNEIKNALSNMGLEGYMLDGELIRINHDNLPSEENFSETASIVNSKSEDKTGLEFVLFDMTTMEDYHKQENNETYEKRLTRLKTLVQPNDFIRLVPIYGVTTDIEEVYRILDEVVEQDLEGLMLNLASGTYRFGKRSSELLKVKAMQTCDLKCIDVRPGDGKYSNTLGTIVCSYKGYVLKVGSGLTDELRDYFWKHPEEIVNKIVEIQYFEETKNEQGGLSLRFPVFKRIRDDKDDVSYE